MDIYAVSIALFSLLPLLILRLTGKFILFAIFAIVSIVMHGTYFFGSQFIYLIFLTYIISTIAELVSLKTFVNCFGVKYRYNLKHSFFSSRIFLLGVYPLEISLAWVMLKYISFDLAMLIAQAFSLPLLVTIMLIPLILVSLDFILDPVAVNKAKLWRWEKGSRYFGIPLRNFLGWYIVGLVASVLYLFIDHGRTVTFHILHIFPIIFYASILQRVPQLLKLDRTMAMLGSLPAFLWTILGIVSLVILFLR